MVAVTGFTAAHMNEIANACIVSGHVTSGNLILVTRGGSEISSGSVAGPTGPVGGNFTICTHATRPSWSSGDAGKSIYETDTHLEYLWTGSAWVNPVSGAIDALMPIGFEMTWPGTIDTIPANFLPEDGRTVSRTTYATLFSKLSTNWNTGGEAGTDFRLPNMENRVVVGAGGTYAVGNYGGENTHILSLAEMPAHAHTEAPHTHTMNQTLAASGMGVAVMTPGSGSASTTGFGNGAGTGSQGSNNAHNNMQAFAAKLVIIRAL